ncbi:trehalose-phosphatase [Allomyces macrogynus ATCC 38327]|uniref:Trehalose-phosphatase n=1 Tax=Allomyces macrogynus (strain ATCC 38327) TaxID=578462 RepID=A0A0L0TB48_ALLM3|nr:trehalose-phosphatase [Allomyces macrogynus ATCC 38327]|eukprot:KNE71940.1 trehalose-phosphatase [Allomyces macrogynus ATCC 38327]
MSPTAAAIAPSTGLESTPSPTPRRVIHVLHMLPIVAVRLDRVASSLAPSAPNSRRHSRAATAGMNGSAPLTPTAPSFEALTAALHHHHQRDATRLDDLVVPDTQGKWGYAPRRGHGALYAGIQSLDGVDGMSCVYVGSLGQVVDVYGRPLVGETWTDDEWRELMSMLWVERKCVPVDLDDATATAFYEGYCKADLWPILHYSLWDSATDGRQEKSHWDAYCRANAAYASTAACYFRPGDLVCVHDYHLLLVPAHLRTALDESALIGFFLHTPFPSSEVFRCLPSRAHLLHGVLGASLIGAQTYSYTRHLLSACTRILGLETTPTGIDLDDGRHVAVGTFPIGIDVARALHQANDPVVRARAAALRDQYRGRKMIVGRDKLDQIRGVHQKLLAFAQFLDMYPQWRDQVVLIQVTSPSSADSSKGSTKGLEAKVSELVAQINGKYGSLEVIPVVHIHRAIDQSELYALLSAADVGLITSVRDGFNTSSHHFIVAQHATQQAPLLLSEFTGTAGSLSSAMLMNPWDRAGVAAALHAALTLPDHDRAMRHAQMYAHVSRHTAQAWARAFTKALATAASYNAMAVPRKRTPLLPIPKCLAAYRSAKKRLFALDFDGTLSPIVPRPEDAKPARAVLDALRALTADPRNHVYIISGRDQATLDDWLGQHVPNLGLSAEHGSFLKPPGADTWIDIGEMQDWAWKDEVLRIFQFHTERTPGSMIELKKSSVCWHYRLADPAFGMFQAKECQARYPRFSPLSNHLENAVLTKLPLDLLRGKKVLEVRPSYVNKGEIVGRLLSSQRAQPFDYVLCAGDCETDMDMFRRLSREFAGKSGTAFSVMIGPAGKRTVADWHLPAPADLIGVLESMGKMEDVVEEEVDMANGMHEVESGVAIAASS